MQNFEIRRSMRDKRARYLYYPTASGRMVKLAIDHRDGGRNYFSGGTESRGIEMVITTVEVAEGVETFSPFDNVNGRMLLMETARYSEKKIREMAELFDEHAPNISASWSVDRQGTLALIRSIVSGKIAAKAA